MDRKDKGGGRGDTFKNQDCGQEESGKGRGETRTVDRKEEGRAEVTDTFRN